VLTFKRFITVAVSRLWSRPVHAFITLSRSHRTDGWTIRWRTFDAREILRTLTSEVVAVCPTLTFNLTVPRLRTRSGYPSRAKQQEAISCVKGECIGLKRPVALYRYENRRCRPSIVRSRTIRLPSTLPCWH